MGSSYVLLTGATGLLGRYLVRDLLERGVRLAVVVRPSRRLSPQMRVEALMRTWERMLRERLPRPAVLCGDITQPALGLDRKAVRWVARHCDAVLHNAASLTFCEDRSTGEPWRSNVCGTKNVLELCRQTGIKDFHHVSTAYVAGKRTGVVLESELDVGQELSNDYERSKVEAEKLVRACDFLSPPTIYRPAIIVGDSKTGFTTTFHGFYALLRVVYTLASAQGTIDLPTPIHVPVRLKLEGTERKNLVPVDWVSQAIAEIFVARQWHGRTYHLTPEWPVTSRMLCEVVQQVSNFRGTQFCGQDANVPEPTESEKLFYEHIRVYDAYWRDDPVFDRTNLVQALPNLPCPTMDMDRLLMLAHAAVRMGFRFRDRSDVAVTLQPAGAT